MMDDLQFRDANHARRWIVRQEARAHCEAAEYLLAEAEAARERALTLVFEARMARSPAPERFREAQ